MPRFQLFAAILLLTTIVRADTPPTAEQIQEWIGDLDHTNFKKREVAARKLRDAGADAAAALAKAAKSGTPETADRALRILGEMADGNDVKTETAARRHLRRLADGESRAANDARTILDRKRNRVLALFLLNGVSYRETR